MTKYIYKLIFPNTNKVYIGQALNPKKRFVRHCQRLRDGKHHSISMQSEYPNCGIPIMEIIEETTLEQVNAREIYWIKYYNSYFEGYNDSPGGRGTGSEGSNVNSKHNLEDYMCVLTMLAYTDMTTKEIADETGLSQSIVLGISSQSYHNYLQNLMPVEWNLMLSKSRHHPNWKYYPKIVSPYGQIYNITNARAFAREHNLCQSSLGKVLRGQAKSHKGWVLAAKESNANSK